MAANITKFSSLSCVTIGAPMVGNWEFMQLVNSRYRSVFEHWLRCRDPIPLYPKCPSLVKLLLEKLSVDSLLSQDLDPIVSDLEETNSYHSAGTCYGIKSFKETHNPHTFDSIIEIVPASAVEQVYSTWDFIKYHEIGCFLHDFAAEHLLYKYQEDFDKMKSTLHLIAQ